MCLGVDFSFLELIPNLGSLYKSGNLSAIISLYFILVELIFDIYQNSILFCTSLSDSFFCFVIFFRTLCFIPGSFFKIYILFHSQIPFCLIRYLLLYY